MRNIICILFVLLTWLSATAQHVVTDFEELQDCDLLFHVPDEGNCITDVTSGTDRISADHVAIFVRVEGIPMVIDATHRGVAVRLADSIKAEKGHYIRVRVPRTDKHRTLQNALRFVGRPYDYKFHAGDNEIYCSELVQKSYVGIDGKRLFNTIPMSFHDDTGSVTKYWKDYYRERWNEEVPEGEEGTNPADIYVQALRMR